MVEEHAKSTLSEMKFSNDDIIYLEYIHDKN